MPAGGLMYHQVNAVRLLHSALPDGWRIAVKEHPQMLKYGREWPRARGTTFYEELTALEHVDLAPVDFPSAELIERAAIVATIAGSAGWEALLCGRFVIAFGYPFYGRAPGVTLASTVADCESAIADAAAHDFRTDLGLLQVFVDEFVEHHTFLGPWDDESARHSDSGWEGLVAAAAERLRRARRRHPRDRHGPGHLTLVSDEQPILAIVPARGGSKGVSRKNMRLLGDRPLIAHARRRSRPPASRTGSWSPATTTRSCAGRELHGYEARARPDALAADEATISDVARHVARRARTGTATWRLPADLTAARPPTRSAARSRSSAPGTPTR